MKRFVIGLLFFVFCSLILGCCSTSAVHPDSLAATAVTIGIAGFPSFQPAYERMVVSNSRKVAPIQVQYVPRAEPQANLILHEQAAGQ